MSRRRKVRLDPAVRAIRREAQRLGIDEAQDHAGWAALCLLHYAGNHRQRAVALAQRNGARPQDEVAQAFWSEVADAVGRVAAMQVNHRTGGDIG